MPLPLRHALTRQLLRPGWPLVRALRAAVGLLLTGWSTLAAQGGTSPTPPVVRGMVFDSTSMRPLRGARVQLVQLPVQGNPRFSQTDSTGGFAFDSIALGSYLLAFSHPRLDTIGVEPSVVRVDLRTMGTLVAPLATPSVATLVRATCRSELQRDSTGILRGFARSARDGFPVARARLRLEWPEYVLGRAGMERTTRAIDAEASESGAFLICGVPLGTTLLASAHAGRDSSGVVEVEVPTDGFLRRDLLLGAESVPNDSLTAAVPRTDSLLSDSVRTDSTGRTDAKPAARPPANDSTGALASVSPSVGPFPGGARIRGVVRSPSGTPVGGARVRVLGGTASTVAGDDGAFLLHGVASGSRMLDVRAIGYLPGKAAVEVMASAEAATDVVLQPADVAEGLSRTMLDTMRVRESDRLTEGALSLRREVGRRMQSGIGQFLTDSAIRARSPHLPSELFRGMPGLTVTNGSGGQGVYMRASATFNATKGLCLPTVFVDGSRAPRAPVDQMAIVADMRAVEIYARGELAPTQFQTSDGCGAIVIWTRSMWDASRTLRQR